MTVKQLKKGDYFTKKDILYPKDTQVFIRGDYDRTLKKYECFRYSDINDIQYISGNKEIFTNLIF